MSLAVLFRATRIMLHHTVRQVRNTRIQACLFKCLRAIRLSSRETVTVGGTRQVGDSDLQHRPEDRDEVWKRACKYMPSLEVRYFCLEIRALVLW